MKESFSENAVKLSAGHLVYLRPCPAAGRLDAEKNAKQKFTVEPSFLSRASDFIAIPNRLVRKKSYLTISKLMTYKIVVLFLKERLASLSCCKVTIQSKHVVTDEKR